MNDGGNRGHHHQGKGRANAFEREKARFPLISRVRSAQGTKHAAHTPGIVRNSLRPRGVVAFASGGTIAAPAFELGRDGFDAIKYN
jgi:hypothetical protein